MDDKVFCEDCRNFCVCPAKGNTKEKVWCEIPGGKDTWRKRAEPIIGDPAIKNQNNDCEDYNAENKKT